MAQTFPSKAITVYSNAAGGAAESIFRSLLNVVQTNTGANFIVEPRPGAAGVLALDAGRKSNDGHSFVFTYASALNFNPLVNKSVNIDPFKDFKPVSNIMSMGVVITATQNAPYGDLRDLLAAAKAKPDSVSIGVFSAGNRSWLAMLEERAGTKLVQVPFRGTSDMIPATLGGHVTAHFESPGTVLAQKGKLKALVYGGSAPSAQFPGVPLMRDLYGFDMQTWYGVVAPAGTPQAALDWMGRELMKATKDAKIVQMIESASLTPVGNSQADFAKELRVEVEANAAILRKYPDIR